jgi:hypothetical protein
MPMRGDNFEMLPVDALNVIDKTADEMWPARQSPTEMLIDAFAEARTELQSLRKLVEAADYLQHCRRRGIQAHQFGVSHSAKKSVERASDQYDYLRGQVKL